MLPRVDCANAVRMGAFANCASFSPKAKARSSTCARCNGECNNGVGLWRGRGVLLRYGAVQEMLFAHPVKDDAPLSPTSQTVTFSRQFQYTSEKIEVDQRNIRAVGVN